MNDSCQSLVETILSRFRDVEVTHHGPDACWLSRLDTYNAHRDSIANGKLLGHPRLRQWWLDRIGPGEPAPDIVWSLLPWATTGFPTADNAVVDAVCRVLGSARYPHRCREMAREVLGALLADATASVDWHRASREAISSYLTTDLDATERRAAQALLQELQGADSDNTPAMPMR